MGHDPLEINEPPFADDTHLGRVKISSLPPPTSPSAPQSSSSSLSPSDLRRLYQRILKQEGITPPCQPRLHRSASDHTPLEEHHLDFTDIVNCPGSNFDDPIGIVFDIPGLYSFPAKGFYTYADAESVSSWSWTTSSSAASEEKRHFG